MSAPVLVPVGPYALVAQGGDYLLTCEGERIAAFFNEADARAFWRFLVGLTERNGGKR